MTAKPRPVREKKAVKVWLNAHGHPLWINSNCHYNGQKHLQQLMYDTKCWDAMDAFALLPWSEYRRLKQNAQRVVMLEKILNEFPAAISAAGEKDGWVHVKEWQHFANSITKAVKPPKRCRLQPKRKTKEGKSK